MEMISRELKSDLAYFFVFTLLFLLLFSSFFLRPNTIYERDSTILEIPLRLHTAELLKQGNYALWTDSHGNGQPFLANPKMALFYPTTWLYLILPFFIAFKFHYLIHPLIGWLGMYLLAKTYDLSRRAAFLSSSLFFLSGMYLSSFEFYNHIAAIAWMMWALYLQKTDQKNRNIIPVWNIVVWALLIISGAPEFIIITLLLSLMQLFMRFPLDIKGLWRLGRIILVAIFISAVQLFPAAELASNSSRDKGDGAWSLELVQLPNMIFPNFLGDDRSPGHVDYWGGSYLDRGYPLYYSLYVGFGFFILLFFSLSSFKKRKITFLFWTATIFFLMASGKYFFILFYLYRKLPILSTIRYPVKYFIGTIFCGAILTGIGFDRLTAGGFRARHNNRSIAFLILIALIALIFVNWIGKVIADIFIITDLNSRMVLNRSLALGLVFLIVYLILIFLMLKGGQLKRYSVTLLIVLVIFDLIYNNKNINPTIPETHFSRPTILNGMKTPGMVWREEELPNFNRDRVITKKEQSDYIRQTLYPYIGINYGLSYFLNKDFMRTYPKKLNYLRERILKFSAEEKRKVLSYVGCHYMISPRRLGIGDRVEQFSIEGYPCYLEELHDARRKPYVARRFVKVDNTEKAIELFVDESFHPEEVAIIGEGISISELEYYSISPGNLTGSDPDEIIAIQESSGYGKYFVSLKEAGIVIFPGNYIKGWKAWLDNKRVEMFEANLFSKGIMVPQGRHELILKYFPDSFIAGGIISLSSISILIVFCCYNFFFRKLVDRKKPKY